MNDKPTDAIALYVHFPWCVAKCPYCDFNSHPLRGTLDESSYVAALLQDLQATLHALDAQAGHRRWISSVFFGGGTPSLFQPHSFEQLLQALDGRLQDGAEVTMEANPGTTEYSDFKGYRSAGINRLSLGAQSFSNAQLQRLGRVHNSADTQVAFAKARQGGFERINLDIMYALPEQSTAAAMADLQTALALAPEHLSWYQLTLEPRTEFYRRPPTLPADATVEQIEVQGRQALADAGYSRYEVSAYAQPAQASTHNINYWTFGDYLGIGAGAHGKLRRGAQTLRTAKPSQPRRYLANPLSGTESAIASAELPAEFALNALRLVAGVERDRYRQQTGRPVSEIESVWQQLAGLGLMRTERFAATAEGYALLDSLVARFL